MDVAHTKIDQNAGGHHTDDPLGRLPPSVFIIQKHSVPLRLQLGQTVAVGQRGDLLPSGTHGTGFR